MITLTLIEDENERLDITFQQFKDNYPHIIEPAFYNIARQLSENYDGGFWDFFKLSNGGFLQIPSDGSYNILCPNDYEAVVNNKEFGIIVCMYAYSSLSFRDDMQDLMAHHYHLLRDYVLELDQNHKILNAID